MGVKMRETISIFLGILLVSLLVAVLITLKPVSVGSVYAQAIEAQLDLHRAWVSKHGELSKRSEVDCNGIWVGETGWFDGSNYCKFLKVRSHGTWKDMKTGLTWQKVSPKGVYNWEQAKAYCEYNEAGLSGVGWRLPNKEELVSIRENSENTNGCFWGDALQGLCGWSWASPGINSSYSWAVNFGEGFGNFGSEVFIGSSLGVRCVRTY